LSDSALVKAIARAFRWRKLLEIGVYGSGEEIAAAEKINASYGGRILRLTLLAPEIAEAILDGRRNLNHQVVPSISLAGGKITKAPSTAATSNSANAKPKIFAFQFCKLFDQAHFLKMHRLESAWKERLHTCEFGLNEN
jgi:hypothetical protein